MYSRFTRLHDGRLLLTYSHRLCQWLNDDGWGTGLRGIISYDDGATFDLKTDKLILTAEDEFYPRIHTWHPHCWIQPMVHTRCHYRCRAVTFI